MTRFSNIPHHIKKAIRHHKCTDQNNTDTCITLSQSDDNIIAAVYFIGLRKHSRRCLTRNINKFKRVFGWSLFRIIMFCAVNNIPFTRDFTPAEHSRCTNQMNCNSCILQYEYNFLYTGFRKSSNRFLLSIIKKIDKHYSTYYPFRALIFINTALEFSVTHTNFYIFKILLCYYKNYITVSHINTIIKLVYEKRETIDINFLTLCLSELTKYAGQSVKLKNELVSVPVASFNITANRWRDIVELRIISYKSVIYTETGLPDVLVNIINDYNYINPDIRYYL